MSESTNNGVVIKDACIFFDLIDMGLLGSFYELGLRVFTTPQVIDEVKDEQQLAEINVYIANGKLQIDQFGHFDMIVAILDTNPGLGFTDASVIEAATRHSAAILSSDKSLRSEATRRNLTVNGLLWVLEELWLRRLVTASGIIEKLQLYCEVNKRAPIIQVKQLIDKLQKDFDNV